MEQYILSMKDIVKSFPGVRALKGVSLSVRPGTVHALLGENGAGKSTLMKCLFGIYHRDSGSIYFDGQEVEIENSLEALKLGISMVHQELNQVRSTNIIDNIWLGRFPKKGLFIDEKKLYDDTKKIFDELEIKLDPREKISNLTVSEAQMVEISKAISYNSKLIVMDEPTSSLSQKEVDQLFRIINKLRDRNVSIIYISHKLDEIKEICDDYTIMRDGSFIKTGLVKDISTKEMVNLMVGRSLDSRYPEIDHEKKEKILEVLELTAVDPQSIKNVSFDLYRGEILGVAGLVGSKRTDLLECLFGERKVLGGVIKKNGEEIVIKNSRDAIKNGLAMVTEDRRGKGILPEMNVGFNSTISSLKNFVKHGLLDYKKMKERTQWVIDSMRVKTSSQGTKIKTLSGGNQQKVIIGRWLLTQPDILLLDEPTRGIDVGAKYEIYELMMNMAKEGKAVMMVSSEMPEILGVSDRILVMSNGRLAGILNKEDATQEEILRLSAKYL